MNTTFQLTPTSLLAASLAAGALFSSCKPKQESTETTGTTAEATSQKVLRFSAIPDQDTTAQTERYAPAAKWLSKQLGVTFEFVPSSDYAASVDKFENGDIQLAWFGGVSGVQARDAIKGSRALVAGAKDLEFKSYFIANASTGLTKSDEFPKGIGNMTFTFGSSGSTSGCIMPAFFILENSGKGPLDFFSQKPGFSGAHDKTAIQVQNGVFQTGAMNYSTYDRMVAEKKIDPAKCLVIWETPPYADYNFTAHGDLDKTFGEGFTDKLQTALLECKDPAVLKAFDRKQFVKVDNSTFQGIADVMKKVKLK
ncbi:putative selenate ABC transporter substrate-binding protein [Verrucomicrobiaceae bacterium N1E253]|uniref:Putative selenate ABC transporter substrate-binding protein n=1 Tax=Oceaniferula marina TaxID=2748318 RepID=A0A851GPK3_9BACT|nr:putative selenate ABC transporter substrate-binding protein [Oceaniferula marina]NWK56074.1 putative selenate ABC transporter substrate-binding protein [Oceaniferula marina]